MKALIVIPICLLLNGILAATELAFVSISKARAKSFAESGEKNAVKVLNLRENPEKTLSIIQLGITFVGIVAAAVGGIGTTDRLGPYLAEKWGISPLFADWIALFIFAAPYTFFSVLLSELLPKSLALRSPKKILFWSVKWIRFLEILLYPFVYLLEKSTKFLARLFTPLKEEELPLGSVLRPYMLNLAKLEHKSLSEVMIPWDEVVKVEENFPTEKLLSLIHETGHTRLPVTKEGKVTGLLHTKEFVAYQETDGPKWGSLIRPIIQIAPTLPLVSALRLMQNKRSHLSVIIDQEENPQGIVTIEDIIEEIIGKIYDEFD